MMPESKKINNRNYVKNKYATALHTNEIFYGTLTVENRKKNKNDVSILMSDVDQHLNDITFT
jgi:hypothetical protein